MDIKNEVATIKQLKDIKSTLENEMKKMGKSRSEKVVRNYTWNNSGVKEGEKISDNYFSQGLQKE